MTKEQMVRLERMLYEYGSSRNFEEFQVALNDLNMLLARNAPFKMILVQCKILGRKAERVDLSRDRLEKLDCEPILDKNWKKSRKKI